MAATKRIWANAHIIAASQNVGYGKVIPNRLPQKWGAGGVGLRGEIDGKQVGVCFLAPKFASKQDRIELACATLAKQISQDKCSQLQNAIRNAAGENVLGTSMISVIQPGLLAAAKRKALTKVFVDLL